MDTLTLVIVVIAFGLAILFLINRLVNEAQSAARLALRAATTADAAAAHLAAAVGRIERDLLEGHARADDAHAAATTPGEVADAAARTDV